MKASNKKPSFFRVWFLSSSLSLDHRHGFLSSSTLSVSFPTTRRRSSSRRLPSYAIPISNLWSLLRLSSAAAAATAVLWLFIHPHLPAARPDSGPHHRDEPAAGGGRGGAVAAVAVRRNDGRSGEGHGVRWAPDDAASSDGPQACLGSASGMESFNLI